MWSSLTKCNLKLPVGFDAQKPNLFMAGELIVGIMREVNGSITSWFGNVYASITRLEFSISEQFAQLSRYSHA